MSSLSLTLHGSSQKTLYSDNVVLRTLLPALKDNTFVAIGSKYDIRSYNVSVKPAMWNVFAIIAVF